MGDTTLSLGKHGQAVELDGDNVHYGRIYLFERVTYAVCGFFLVSLVSATLFSTFIAF